jgi:hypothetical protein
MIARADAKLEGAEHFKLTSGTHQIAAYRFGQKLGPNAKTVVLVHGWMSGARFMLAIMDRLVSLGHEVICFDLPAHGKSTGKRTNLVECAAALTAVIRLFGPVDAVVAHSFGGAVSAFALSESKEPLLSEGGEIILLASPNRLTEVTKSFARQFGISDKGRLVFEKHLCTPMQQPIEAMDGNIMFAKTGNAMHVLHCRDDREVSVEEGRRFAQMGPDVNYVELTNLGHRKILYAEPALLAVEAAIGKPSSQ